MGRMVNPLTGKMPKGKTLAEADRSLRMGNGMKALRSSPAFRSRKGKSSDRIGAGKLHRGMRSPI